MATTVAANVNEMRASVFCSVRRTRGVLDLDLTYVDATDARESSRGAIHLIGDAQLTPRLGAAAWRPLLSAPTSAAAAARYSGHKSDSAANDSSADTGSCSPAQDS